MRNGILIAIFAVVLALMVIILPKEPTRPAATLLAPGSAVGDGTPEDLPLRISEVMASNRGAYPDDKGNYSDWLEIENTSLEPVSLEGIGLSDREDRILFLFPSVTLEGGGRLVVFCDDTNAADKNQPLHARFKISALGETLYLFDRNALVMDSVVVPAMNSDISYALTTGGWIMTEQFTPGYPNTDAGYAAFRSQAVGVADGLVINEIVASNRTTLQDEDGEYPDWIELYNGSGVRINLHNYAITDDETNPVKWRFPPDAVIEPGGYYVVFASGKDRVGGGGNLAHTNFKLAAEGETLVLSDILRQPIDRVTYENLGKDVSWGRVEGMDAAWQEYKQPTPGMPNNKQSEIEMDARMRASNTSGVYISEVITTSTGVETPLYGNTSYDWIELVNRGTTAVDLGGWGLSDNIGRPRQWQFKDGTMIQPGEYLLVFASGLLESPTRSGAIHADFRLSALGETVTLCDPDGKILDKLVIPKLETDNSYGRNFDQGGLFYYETPTPGMPNTTNGFAGYAPMPTIAQTGGVYTKPVTASITAPAGVRIRYTTDGSDPTETTGEAYTEPLEFREVTVLRARGFVDGLKPSEVATESYMVNTYHSLPVVSLVTDPDNLWNEVDGMLAEDLALKATYTKQPFKGLAYWKKLPRDGNVEFFDEEGRQIINQGVEIQLNGQYSLDQAQKSFRLTARPRFGETTFAYPFFGDRPFAEYQALILRNGGQDGKYTRIIDGLMSRVIDWTDSTVIHMATRPVIVYLNGDYWGHYNLRERINKYSIAAYEGINDPDSIDFIKGSSNVISGEYNNWSDLQDFLIANDLNDPQALQTVLDWVDVDNLFDFYIFQIYFGNTDAGNIKFYRERVPGAKWRWVVFDLDWAYFRADTNSPRLWLKEEGSGDQLINNRLIRKLLAVPSMRDKFFTRFGQLYQEVLTDTPRIRALADEMLDEIRNELPLHFNRWAGLNGPIISEEPSSPEGLAKYWQDRVDRMYNVLNKRPNQFWDICKDWFGLSVEEMTHYFGPQPVMPPEAY